MTNESLLYIGGFFNLGFAIFHLFFWRIFDWRNDLKSIRYVNRAIMQILNLCLALIFFIFAFISFSYPYDLLVTRIGHTILMSISLFWFLRAFMQFAFFGMRNKTSVVFILLFLLGGFIYIYPIL